MSTNDTYDRKTPKSEFFTKVPNRFLEVLSVINLSAYQMRMFLRAIRDSYGYHDPDRSFNLREFRRALGWDRRNVDHVAHQLVERRMFVVQLDDKGRRNYSIQKDTRKWVLSYRQTTTIHEAKTSFSETTKPAFNRTTPVSSRHTTSSLKKEDIKETKESAHPMDMEASGAAFIEQDRGNGGPKDKEAVRDLSRYRNLMAVSGFYSVDELIGFKDKTLSELEAIHSARLEQGNRRLARGGIEGEILGDCDPV